MVKRISIIFVMLLSFSFSWGSLNAFAKGDDVIVVRIPMGDSVAMADVWSDLGTDGNYMEVETKRSARDEYTDTRLVVYDEERGVLRFYNKLFKDATVLSRKKALGIFIKELGNSEVGFQTQQNIIQTVTSHNGDIAKLLIPLVADTATADMYTAMQWLKPIMPIIQVIFGLGAVIITIMLVGSTILDLVFIGLPVARDALLENHSSGGGKVKFISADAEAVIKEVENSFGDSNYKNPYLLYFKRRVLTYIILSVCLLYLVVGELGNLVAWVLSLGEGIVK